MVGAGQRMGAHYGPIDVVCHVLEESTAFAILQVGEETLDIFGLDSH
jgi:hypothetical protein